jgi:hypothetical protein
MTTDASWDNLIADYFDGEDSYDKTYVALGFLQANADTQHDFSSVRCAKVANLAVPPTLNNSVFSVEMIQRLLGDVAPLANEDATLNYIADTHRNMMDGVVMDEVFYKQLHEILGNNVGFIYDQGDVPEGFFTNPMDKSIKQQRLNLHTVAGSWDEAGKDSTYQVCVALRGRAVPAEMPVKFTSTYNAIRFTQQGQGQGGSEEDDSFNACALGTNTTAPLVLHNTWLMANMFTLSVAKLCVFMNKFKAQGGQQFSDDFIDKQIIACLFKGDKFDTYFGQKRGAWRGKIVQQFRECLKGYVEAARVYLAKTVRPDKGSNAFEQGLKDMCFDIKRSMDSGQCEMALILDSLLTNTNTNDTNVKDWMTVHKMKGGNKVDIAPLTPAHKACVNGLEHVVLVTGDRLCFMRAKIDKTPALLLVPRRRGNPYTCKLYYDPSKTLSEDRLAEIKQDLGAKIAEKIRETEDRGDWLSTDSREQLSSLCALMESFKGLVEIMSAAPMSQNRVVHNKREPATVFVEAVAQVQSGFTTIYQQYCTFMARLAETVRNVLGLSENPYLLLQKAVNKLQDRQQLATLQQSFHALQVMQEYRSYASITTMLCKNWMEEFDVLMDEATAGEYGLDLAPLSTCRQEAGVLATTPRGWEQQEVVQSLVARVIASALDLEKRAKEQEKRAPRRQCTLDGNGNADLSKIVNKVRQETERLRIALNHIATEQTDTVSMTNPASLAAFIGRNTARYCFKQQVRGELLDTVIPMRVLEFFNQLEVGIHKADAYMAKLFKSTYEGETAVVCMKSVDKFFNSYQSSMARNSVQSRFGATDFSFTCAHYAQDMLHAVTNHAARYDSQTCTVMAQVKAIFQFMAPEQMRGAPPISEPEEFRSAKRARTVGGEPPEVVVLPMSGTYIIRSILESFVAERTWDKQEECSRSSQTSPPIQALQDQACLYASLLYSLMQMQQPGTGVATAWLVQAPHVFAKQAQAYAADAVATQEAQDRAFDAFYQSASRLVVFVEGAMAAGDPDVTACMDHLESGDFEQDDLDGRLRAFLAEYNEFLGNDDNMPMQVNANANANANGNGNVNNPRNAILRGGRQYYTMAPSIRKKIFAYNLFKKMGSRYI